MDDRIIGRNQHVKEIENFLQQHVSQCKAASMYISGAPGTGKTLCLKKVATSNQVTAV